ncbi:MAG TPA: prepilin peptidase [Gemmatimonadaceae bacterium]|nr:prepilin peptidase [Gemmatimonadaceae bacterium]
MTNPLAFVAVFVVGACIGSFLNVCIARWPAKQSVVAPRSRCPRCQHAIGWAENIPLVSWVLLRARCRGCGERISAQYPAVELVTALGWLGAFWAFEDPFAALRVAVFGTVLLGIAVTDAKHYLIPDEFTVFGLVWAVGTAAAAVLIGVGLPFAGFVDAVYGACVGAGAIAIVAWLGEVALKKEAMGFGDVTLMAVVGAALGPALALLAIFVGALLGAVVFLFVVYPLGWLRSRRAGGEYELPLVPFGVFLAPAALLTLLWGRTVIDWYTTTILML